jgi:hypothetical protein
MYCTNTNQSTLYKWAKEEGFFIPGSASGVPNISHNIMTGGNLRIPDEHYNQFQQYYVQDIISECWGSLSECVSNVFPFYMDIDFPKDDKQLEVDIVCGEIMEILGKIYTTFSMYVCLNESNGNIHIYTNIFVKIEHALSLRISIVSHMVHHISSVNWDKVIDRAVYGRALRMIYSTKGHNTNSIYRPFAMACCVEGVFESCHWICMTREEIFEAVCNCRIYYPCITDTTLVSYPEYLVVEQSGLPITDMSIIHTSRSDLSQLVQTFLRDLCPEYISLKVRFLTQITQNHTHVLQDDFEKVKHKVIRTLNSGSLHFTLPVDNTELWSLLLSKPGNPSIVLRVRVSTSDKSSRYCFMKGGYHNRQHIYFLLTFTGKCFQYCFDKECRRENRMEWDIPACVLESMQRYREYRSCIPITKLEDLRWDHLKTSIDLLTRYASHT